jgi:hypothetical protein
LQETRKLSGRGESVLPVEIVPIQETVVLRARGSELLILPHHVKHLKTCEKAKDFSAYFVSEALVNRPARKLFEAWLRKDGSLWPRLYKCIHKEMELKADGEDNDAPAKAPKAEAKAKPEAKKTEAKADSKPAKAEVKAAKADDKPAKKAAKPEVKEEPKAKAKEEEKPAKKAKAEDKPEKKAAKKVVTKAKADDKPAAKKKTKTASAGTAKKKKG